MSLLGIEDSAIIVNDSVDSIEHFKELSLGAGATVVKANSEGFFIGADTFEDAPFSVDYQGNITADSLSISAGDVDGLGDLALLDTVGTTQIDSTIISGGKIVTGLLTADNIQAGTLTGRTIKATGSTSGADVWMSNSGILEYRNDNEQVAFMASSTDGTLNIDADDSIVIISDGSGDDIFLSAGEYIGLVSRKFSGVFSGDALLACDNLTVLYNDDNDGSDVKFASNTELTAKLNQSGDLEIAGDFSAANFDFAEFFESVDGKKIDFGVSVVFEKEKIRPAERGETPFGVVSATAAITLNNSMEWSKKYLRDDFGSYITRDREWWSIIKKEVRNRDIKTDDKTINSDKHIEKRHHGWSDDVKPPKGATKRMIKTRVLNPEFDESKKYIPRKEREEWNAVGLVGRVRIRKGQQIAPGWIKIREINSEVDEYLIK